MGDVFCTSYCNQLHSLKTGKPIDHRCNTLPVEALLLEVDGKFEEANDVLENWKRGSSREPHGN